MSRISVKKPATTVAAHGPLVFEGTYVKETSGAVQFKETGPRDGYVSGGIYLRKDALPEGVKVTGVRVTVELITE